MRQGRGRDEAATALSYHRRRRSDCRRGHRAEGRDLTAKVDPAGVLRVGITGANGFVGGHVARHLGAAGHEVCVISRAPRAGSTDRLLPPPDGALSRFRDATRGLDAIVHCAARNNDRPTDATSLSASNVDLTAALAAAAAGTGVTRLVYLSSIRAVAGPGVDVAIDDDTLPAPSDDYGRSKLGGERAALAAAAPGFLPLILRLPPVYGVGMRGNLQLLLRLARLPLPLPLAGLTGRRSLISAEAVAHAVATLLAAKQPARATYLASDAEPVTIPDIVTAFRRGLDRKPRLVAVPEVLLKAAATLAGQGDAWKSIAAAQTCDPASLIAEGWMPDGSSRTGLARLAADLKVRADPG